MLRKSRLTFRVQSHQKNRSQDPNAGTRYGRVYNRGFIRYGFGGFGMSVYSSKKDRRFRVLPPPQIEAPFSDVSGLSSTTRTLSPNFRIFALRDGGLLVAHPSHKDIMQWGQKVLSVESEAKEVKASMDEYVDSRIQSIIANNTIENVSLSRWRKNHMWNLLKSHGKLQRRWGMPDSVQGARTTLFNNK